MLAEIGILITLKVDDPVQLARIAMPLRRYVIGAKSDTSPMVPRMALVTTHKEGIGKGIFLAITVC